MRLTPIRRFLFSIVLATIASGASADRLYLSPPDPHPGEPIDIYFEDSALFCAKELQSATAGHAISLRVRWDFCEFSWGPNPPRTYTFNIGPFPPGAYDVTLTGTPVTGSAWIPPQLATAFVVSDSAGPNHQGLWWNAPAGSESGWGINLADQGGMIFATWFTYDATGRSWWLAMTARRVAPNLYSGSFYTTRGPPFNAVPFNPDGVVPTITAFGTLEFSDAINGTFKFTVGAVEQTKSITRERFGPLPTCTFGGQPNLALATNYTDLWWNAPGNSEAGWGLNLDHQGDTIVATWFTYDLDGTPMWLVATNHKSGPGVYSGELLRTTGPPLGTVQFNPNNVSMTSVGNMSLAFADGNNASFDYTVNTIAGLAKQTKHITRQVFAPPGTVCQ